MQSSLRALVASLCLVLPLGAQGTGLEEARARLLDPAEGRVREGVEACVRANDVAAVGLLIEVLCRTDRPSGAHLAPAHYRDMAWDGLLRITDVYARRRVEHELRQSKDPWVRQWCAEVLGEYGDATHAEPLERALRDSELGVRRAAARALGKTGYKPALKALDGAAKDRDPILRANAVEALSRLAPAENRARFLGMLTDKDAGVRCALLGALPALYPDSAEERSVRALVDEDWRPRLQAVENLAAIRTKGAVDALLRALDDGRPLVAARAVDALQTLTGQRHRNPDVWKRWWADHREGFEFPEGASARRPPGEGDTVASYHGIRLVSDHVAFLIDRSRAMELPSRAAGTSKSAAALRELENVLETLDGRLVFNVIAYHEQMRLLDERRALECNRRTKRQSLEFVTKTPLGGAKDIWQVLERVVLDPDIDTAYLLSSGEPDIGTYVHWNRVTWQLAELNRFHKLTVHTIVYSDNGWYREQLQRIAQTTGGEHTAFD